MDGRSGSFMRRARVYPKGGRIAPSADSGSDMAKCDTKPVAPPHFMKPRVFIGSSTENLKPAYAIQQNLADDAEVKVWKQGIFGLSGGHLEEILKAVNASDFGVFIFAPDDCITIRTQEYTTVRDNVVFEYGLFLGRLGRSRSLFVVPKDAERLWLPTDLSGIVKATYQANTPDLQSALGPACAQIRNRIEELGVRAGRFREESVDAELDTSSRRFQSLAGAWEGQLDQRVGKGPIAGSVTMTLTLMPTGEGLISEGSLGVPNHPPIPLKASGRFFHNKFLKMDYANGNARVMMFGCGMLELDGQGDTLRGEYVGYGGLNDTVVSGTIVLKRK